LLLIHPCSFNKTLIMGFQHPLTVTNIQVRPSLTQWLTVDPVGPAPDWRGKIHSYGLALCNWLGSFGYINPTVNAQSLLRSGASAGLTDCTNAQRPPRPCLRPAAAAVVLLILQFAIGSVLSIIFWTTGIVKPPQLDAKLVRVDSWVGLQA
jgi:hypothetical protein